jgi:hypothetical protein
MVTGGRQRSHLIRARPTFDLHHREVRPTSRPAPSMRYIQSRRTTGARFGHDVRRDGGTTKMTTAWCGPAQSLGACHCAGSWISALSHRRRGWPSFCSAAPASHPISAPRRVLPGWSCHCNHGRIERFRAINIPPSLDFGSVPCVTGRAQFGSSSAPMKRASSPPGLADSPRLPPSVARAGRLRRRRYNDSTAEAGERMAGRPRIGSAALSQVCLRDRGADCRGTCASNCWTFQRVFRP